MANSIETAKKYVPLLDAVYKMASVTAQLDGDSTLVQEGANAGELIIPTITMQGLGDYSRNDGYVKGDVTMTNETVKCNFDRGRMFQVDNMDNEETAGIAFGQLAGEFIRTKVAPELDAFRFATYCGTTGISKKQETLSDGAAVVAALRAAVTKMDEDEVPPENRHLFITPTLLGLVQDMDTTKSREVLQNFASINKVPQSRFYTAIEQKDGKASGEKDGGFVKASGASEVNFMVIHKPAVIQFPKHIKPKIITPEQNPDADAYKYGYRQVGIADVYANKLAGVYASYKPAGT